MSMIVNKYMSRNVNKYILSTHQQIVRLFCDRGSHEGGITCKTIIGTSAGLTIWQKRHMPRAPRFWGPRAFGAPRFSLLFFFLKFCFLFKCGAQTVRQSGAPKSLGPPENSWPQKIDPKRFLFVPCFSVSARGPKERKVPRKRYRPPKFKRPQTIFLFPVLARDPNSAGH